MLKLGTVGLVDAACVNPEEFQPITFSLIPTKLNLGVACFVLGCAVRQVFEQDLFVAPYM